MTEEVICEAATKDFGIPLGGEGGFEYIVDGRLDFWGVFVETESSCRNILVF